MVVPLWTVKYNKTLPFYVPPVNLTNYVKNVHSLQGKFRIIDYYNRVKCHIQLLTFNNITQLFETLDEFIVPEHLKYFKVALGTYSVNHEFCATDFWLSFDSCVHRVAGRYVDIDNDETQNSFKIQFTRLIHSLEEMVDILYMNDSNEAVLEVSGEQYKIIKRNLRYWMEHFQLLFRQHPNHDHINLFVNLIIRKLPFLKESISSGVNGVFVQLDEDETIETLFIPGFTNILEVMRQITFCILKNLKNLMIIVPDFSQPQNIEAIISDKTLESDISIDSVLQSTPNASLSSSTTMFETNCSFCGADGHKLSSCGLLRHFIMVRVLALQVIKNEVVITDSKGEIFNFSQAPHVQCSKFQSYLATISL